MKRLTTLLALLLAVMLPAASLAATVTGEMKMPEEADELLGSGVVLYEDYPEYWLADDNGSAISKRYNSFSEQSDYDMATVMLGEGLNITGLIDTRTGAEILPLQYGTVEIVTEKWILGVELVLSTDPESPYYDWAGNRYDVARADVYYSGTLVATLTEEEFGRQDGYGDFLCISNDAGVIWLNAAGEKRLYEPDGSYSREFKRDYYADTYMHNATGQQAFVPECTLTADQVSEAFIFNDDGVVDLQGRVIIPISELPEDADLSGAGGDYLKLSSYDYETSEWTYAVAKTDGTIIIPFVLAEVPYLDVDDPWFTCGYLPAITMDGQLCFYDETGAVAVSCTLPEGVETYDIDGYGDCAPLLVIEGDEGLMVFSATAGLLDVSAYEDVKYGYSSGHELLCVQQDDKWGCIDVNGELVVPCIFEYEPDISRDSTRVMGSYYTEEYDEIIVLYTLAD